MPGTINDGATLRELIAKATQEELADGGRYFAGTCDDLTRCRHEEIGEYQHSADGELIEWLWNRRHAIADMFATTPSITEPGTAAERPTNEALEPHLPESVWGAKRCGIQRSVWLTGWYVPWSPRNDNHNAEGGWSDWVALATAIIATDAKAQVALAAAAPASGGESA